MAERIPPVSTLRVPLQAYLSSDGKSPATGKTIVIQISKNGAAYGNPSAGATNATEIGNGSYYVDLSTTDTGTLGPLFVRGTEGTIDAVVAIYNVAYDSGVVRRNLIQSNATALTAQLDTSASATAGIYVGSTITIVASTGVEQTRTIVAYSGLTKRVFIDRPWVTQPNSTSVFEIRGMETPPLNTSLQVSSGAPTTTLFSGTAQAGSTSTTIVLASTALATDNIYNGMTVSITGGTGLSQERKIVAYNGTTKVATVERPWTTTPDATSTFNVIVNLTPMTFSHENFSQGATSNTITLAPSASATDNIYTGSLLTILSGTDTGDTVLITGYVGSTKVATVSPNFAVTPTVTSVYAIIPTVSATGTLVSTIDANVVSYASVPTVLSGGFPEVSIAGYVTGQDPATLWGAAALAACIGLPTTNGQALRYFVQQRNNKESANKTTGAVILYEDNGTSPKSTQTYTNTSTTVDRTAMS